MAENNTSNIGFEKQIWDAACVLRGNIDASEYKSVVLGLIFLKYISDRFEAKYKELVEEGDGFEEDQDEYTAENIFFVPENARWSAIAAAAHTPEIGTVIDDAMRSIEKENKRLKDILPKNFARPELDKRRLGEVVDLFTNIQMIEHGSSKDILGRTYEYCLSKFAEQEGKLAGEFYTPSCVVRTLVEVLQPFNGRVYDPCCGSGGMFVQSAKFIENHGGNINKISVFGQDSNPTTWKMAQMNLAIRGIEADLGKFNADTFFNDCHPQLKADFIMANPPFNLSGWGADKLVDDVRWQYGTPPAGNANFAWLQHMIWHLAPNGRIGMVLANGSLSSQSGGEGEIRKNIINADLVDCIVAMPTQLFYTTQIPVSLWFLAKNKKQKGKTLFIDARKLGTMVTRKLRELTDEDIKKIADTYNAFVDGTLEDEKGFCAVVTTQDIAKQDYILTPGRYVGIEEQEDDGEPFEEKMGRLTSELSELFAKSHELEAQIKDDWGRLGMTSEWRTIRAADFIDFNPRLGLKKGDIATKVAMDKLKPFTKKIPETEKAEFNGGAKFCNGDTVMARITPCLENGKTAYVDMLDDGEIGFGSTEFIVMRAKTGISDPQFVYYTAINPVFRNVAIKSMVGSSGRQRVQQSVLEELELSVPDLDEQRRIGDFLARIDEKIALNDRINDNLLAQAQTLYKQFFPYGVQDDLPDGWRIGTVGEIIEIHDSKRIPLSGADRTKMEKKIYPYYGAASLMDFVDNYIFDGKYLLLGEDGTVVDDAGYPILQYVWGQFWVNNHAHILTGRLGYDVESLYMLFKQTPVKSIVTGAVQPKISQANLRSVQVVIPPEHNLREYNDLVEPLFSLFRANEEECKTFTALRDMLLPKLMSGEIDVSAVQL